MSFKKYLHTNKGFFILSLIAAILGLAASFFFGGCDKVEKQSDVIASKRVKVEVKDVVAETIIVPSERKAIVVARNEVNTGKKKKSTVRRKKTAPGVKQAKKRTPEGKAKKPLRKRTAHKPHTKTWAINVASFTRLSEARRLKKRLISTGRNAYITEFTKSGTHYYRVRVGFFATRAKAKSDGRAISASFKNTGDAWVTRPGKTEIDRNSN